MRTTSEAPVAEPQPVERDAEPGGGRQRCARQVTTAPASGAAVEVEGLAHAFGALRVIERLDLSVAPGEVLGVVGPSGCGKSTLLELISGLRAPQTGAIEVGGAGLGHRAPRPLRVHAAARPAASVAGCDRQRRRWRCETAGPRASRRAGSPIPCSSASGWRASSAHVPPSSPAGCASESPSCARCWPASRCCSWTSRSRRWTRSPAPRCRSGWRRRSPPSRVPWSWSRTTSRRLSTCPTG